MTKLVPLGKITANKKRRKVGKYSEHVGGICSHSRHLTHISEQASTNNEELAMFPQERIERPPGIRRQEERRKVGDGEEGN